jgi:hypothetical protein
LIGLVRFLAPWAALCVLCGPGARTASAAPFSAGTFAASPTDNRFALAAGLGMNSGLALGVAYSGPFVGLQVLAGYLPTYTAPPGCTIFCGLDGVTAEHGAAVAADVLVPLLCDRRTCLGLKGGYRHSSLLGPGGGGGLYGASLGRGWLRFAGTIGVTYYPEGLGGTPLFLGTNLSGNVASTFALGTEVTLTFSPWVRTP